MNLSLYPTQPLLRILLSSFFTTKTTKDTKFFLVPTRRVGMQFQRSVLISRPQRGRNEFPRSAWELGIEAADWSLTPGRYVGVAPEEVDEDFDFEETLGDIHIELKGLNEEAAELAAQIAQNFEGLGV